MKVDFKRIPHKWTFTFEATIGKANFTAYVKRLFIPYPRIVQVEENGSPSFHLQEQTLLRRFLLKLLFLPFTSYLIKKKSKYSIMEDDHEVGTIEYYLFWSEHKWDIEYKNTKYTIYQMIHKRHIRYYFVKDHYQVGVIEQSNIGYNRVKPYYGTIHDDVPKQVVLTLLLHVHIHKLHDFALSYIAYSRSYTAYAWQSQNKDLDIEFDHIELSKEGIY
jgi:hypothetical protein